MAQQKTCHFCGIEIDPLFLAPLPVKMNQAARTLLACTELNISSVHASSISSVHASKVLLLHDVVLFRHLKMLEIQQN